MSEQTTDGIPTRWEVRRLFQAAMLVFVVTVVIGILNGSNVVEFTRAQLLAHVHAGTLGWITLGVLAACLWLFEGSESSNTNGRFIPAMTVLAIGSVPLFALAFLTGDMTLRAIFAIPVLVAIIGLFGWVIARSSCVRHGVAHLAILGAVLNLAVGSAIGALMQVQMATQSSFLPMSVLAAHPMVMVIGYLILIGMAVTEWRFGPTGPRRPR